MYYGDLRVWVPDDEILGVRFFKHEKFYIKQFLGMPYIIVAEIAGTGRLVGFCGDGKIYVLDTESNSLHYASSALSVFARQLKAYRDFSGQSEENADDLSERLKKLDGNALGCDDNFWSIIFAEEDK